MHSIEIRFLTGLSNIMFANLYVSTFSARYKLGHIYYSVRRIQNVNDFQTLGHSKGDYPACLPMIIIYLDTQFSLCESKRVVLLAQY